MFQALKNEGTVKPALNFNPSGDAAVLDKAIKTKGEAEMHEGCFGACASMLWCCNVYLSVKYRLSCLPCQES